MNRTAKRVLKWGGILVLVVLMLGAGLALWARSQMPKHSPPASPPAPVQASGDPTLDAIRRGLEYLRVHQEADGHFVAGRLSPKPAFTALVVDVFLNSPDAYSVEEEAFLRKAVDAIISEQKESGSIHTEIPGMSFASYSTSVALLALAAVEDPRYAPAVSRATEYLKGGQHPAGSVNQGGFGYGEGTRADLNNTCTILEALEAAGVPKDDPVWENARIFIANCQNRSESNHQAWAGDDGGFIYCPVGLEPGQVGRDGQPRHASYGTMSYAGLISFLYADVDKDDPRVKSAYRWICENYDLDENVGKKGMGLYYYYRIMAKALQRYGHRTIMTSDGVEHDWPRELAAQLVRLQRPDGSWVNANGAFLEDDPILVTSYAVRALSICHEMMDSRKSTASP